MNWIHRQSSDNFVKKRIQKGYISRALFKLEEIHNKYHIIYKNTQVLDLGACPGGWTQYLMKYTHNITAVDIGGAWRITNIPLIKCDIFDLNLNMKFDLIVSDIACNISGNNDIDEPMMSDILERILQIVKINLRKNGNFVCKLFGYNQYLFRKLGYFNQEMFYKPKSSRSESAEIYFVGKGYKYD